MLTALPSALGSPSERCQNRSQSRPFAARRHSVRWAPGRTPSLPAFCGFSLPATQPRRRRHLRQTWDPPPVPGLSRSAWTPGHCFRRRSSVTETEPASMPTTSFSVCRFSGTPCALFIGTSGPALIYGTFFCTMAPNVFSAPSVRFPALRTLVNLRAADLSLSLSVPDQLPPPPPPCVPVPRLRVGRDSSRPVFRLLLCLASRAVTAKPSIS